MGVIRLQLPAEISADAAMELQRAHVIGGPDSMPWPTQVHVEPGCLSLERDVDESGFVAVPWDIHGLGRLMGSTTTLMEQEWPYRFRVELARGKVNQVRSQAADWRVGGLPISAELEKQIHKASLAFGKAVLDPQTDEDAQVALVLSYRAAQDLTRAYSNQVFEVRQEREPRLSSELGCRLGGVPPDRTVDLLLQSCNSIALAFKWGMIEPTEGNYQWQETDALLDWAETRGLAVTAGPLVDFSSAQLPAWLWRWERDTRSITRFLVNYATAAVKRYGKRIRRWQLTSASNSAAILSLREEDLLSVTVQMTQAVGQIEPDLQIVAGIVQPWGEYMATESRNHSPFIFADTLMRLTNNLSALDLEIVMGCTPRGSYCRDLLEISRMLDLYAVLGVPLRITLGYPSADSVDPNADPELGVGGGYWEGGFQSDVQAEWAASVAALSLCKPYVQAVQWVHACDSEAHQFPHCGLFDASDQPKPAIEELRQLRAQHLR
jgi:hypothetical protein